MAENPWTAGDIAMASVKLQQHLFTLLVAKGLVSEGEIQHMVADLIGKMHKEPGGDGVAEFLKRAFGVT
ncbi:hypothetical protein [Sphingobium sp.]|uniref:hypothetical protein n=1 Tax=Sphingobium sp. TaxID=1912891 RepID=UPI003BB6AEFB